MSKFLKFLFVSLLASFALAACAPAIQGVVSLPNPLKVAITGVVVWIVAWVFAKIVVLIPWVGPILEPYKEPLALLIAASLIGFIEATVPDAYGAVAVAAIELLLVILALFGIGSTLGKKRGVKFFK